MDRHPLKQIGVVPEDAFKQAVMLYNQGKLREAEKLYRKILKDHPKNFGTLYNLAGVLWRAERFEEAAQFLRKALNQDPNSVGAHSLLASVFQSLGRYDEALKRARRAIALNSGSAEAHNTLARVLADLGRHDEAIRAQSRAIELAPNQPRYYFGLGSMMQWTVDDPHLAALKALAQKSGSLSLDEQIYLHFAIGKAYADCGNIEAAFRCQIEGGALKRRTLSYKEESTLRQLDELCGIIDAAWMQQRQDVGDPSPLPVFILGMPRSGTTLVEQILSSHPKVHSLGESAIFATALAGIGNKSMPRSITELASQWTDSGIRRLAKLYLETVQRRAPAAVTRIIDKTPWNFRYIGLIHAALPNARIIHTCRDPMDSCLSMFSTLFWASAQPYSYDLGELGRYYHAYEKVMAHWRSILSPTVMLEVQYEDIVDDVERQARRIIFHCGLEWDPACLDFDKTDRPIRTASQTQVRKPIYRRSVGRPRPPLELLRPLLDTLDAKKTIVSG
jgi:tetratricopeptide (TPR) repeat protein